MPRILPFIIITVILIYLFFKKMDGVHGGQRMPKFSPPKPAPKGPEDDPEFIRSLEAEKRRRLREAKERQAAQAQQPDLFPSADSFRAPGEAKDTKDDGDSGNNGNSGDSGDKGDNGDTGANDTGENPR